MYQVIIADDEAKIRSGLANLFPWNQLGFEIAAVCSNGKEALDFAMENPVDLVLSDIRMPIMDGLELSRLLLCPSSHEKRGFRLSFKACEI